MAEPMRAILLRQSCWAAGQLGSWAVRCSAACDVWGEIACAAAVLVTANAA